MRDIKGLRPAYIITMTFDSGVKAQLVFVPKLQQFAFKINNELGHGWVDVAVGFAGDDEDTIEMICNMIRHNNFIAMLDKIDELQKIDLRDYEQKARQAFKDRIDALSKQMGMDPNKRPDA